MEPVLQFECRDSNLEIYVVQPGERLTIYGSCSLLCLAGNAMLNDYILPCVSCEAGNFFKISAPHRMDVPAIIQVGNCGQNYKPTRLKFRLKEVAPKDYENIMAVIGDTTPAVFVFSKVLDAAEETVSGVIPNFLIHSSIQKQVILPPSFMISRDDFAIIPRSEEAALKQQLDRLNALRKDGQKSTIIPIGHKGAGKSSLMRNLVNRCFSGGHEQVYVLDCDIGQSEFTPAGCLSLHKITTPILDRPHGHQKKKFDNAYFFGDITIHNSQVYLDLFERLWNKYEAMSEPGSLCIVNTMGWVTDVGAAILDHIVEVTNPQLCVQIYRDQSEPRYSFKKKSNTVTIFANNSMGLIGLPAQKRLPPSLIRDLTVIGYFSSILPRPSLASFSKVAPYKMKFRSTTICIPVDLLVEDRHLFTSINTQLVALCRKTSGLNPRKLCGREDMPSLCVLDDNKKALQCIGFGIIRGVSVENRAIYIVTPVDLRTLDEPPMLVRGMRIQTPAMFYTADPFNRCPYVLNLSDQAVTSSLSSLDCLYQPSINTTQFKRSRRC